MSRALPLRRLTVLLACLTVALGGGLALAGVAHAAPTTTTTTTTPATSSSTGQAAGTPADNDFLTNSTMGFDTLGGTDGWIALYPSSYFGLDAFIPTTSTNHVGLFGVNVASVNAPDLGNIPAYLMQGIAQMIWTVIRWITDLMILFSAWAFSFPLLSDLLGGIGSLLDTIEAAVGLSPNNPAETSLVGVALAILGGVAVWRIMVKQELVRTVTSIAMSVVAIAIAVGIMTSLSSGNGGIVWTATCASNNLATGILSTVDTGSATSGGTSCNPNNTSAAQEALANDLYKTLVVYPWVTLEFNGVSHCTNAPDSALTYSADSPNCLVNISNFGGTILPNPTNGRKFAAGRGGYVYQYLLYPPGSIARQIMYYAIAGGGTANDCADSPAPPAVASSGGSASNLCQEGTDLITATSTANRESDLLLADLDGNGWAATDVQNNGNLARDAGLANGPGTETTAELENLLMEQAGWNAGTPSAALTQANETAPTTISAADEPAAYLQSSALDAAFQRLAMTGIIGFIELGAWIVLGGLAVMMILTQLLVVGLCLCSPIALVCGIVPGRGHQIFLDWLKRLGGAIFTKVWYALALAILCGISQLIQSQTIGDLGWFGALVLQGVLWWGVFFNRKKIHDLIAKVSIDQQHYGDREPRHPYYAYTGARRNMRMVKALKQNSRGGGSDGSRSASDVFGPLLSRRNFDPHKAPTAGGGRAGTGETDLPAPTTPTAPTSPAAPTTPAPAAPERDREHNAPEFERSPEFEHPTEELAADGIEDIAQHSAERRASEAARAAETARGPQGEPGATGAPGEDADVDDLVKALDKPINVPTPERYNGLVKSNPDISKKLFDAANQQAVNLRRANPRVLPIPGGDKLSRPLTSPARRMLARRATRRGAELAEAHRRSLDNANNVKHATPLAEQQAALVYHQKHAYESRGNAQAAQQSNQRSQAAVLMQRARAHELAAKTAEAHIQRLSPTTPGGPGTPPPPTGPAAGGTPPSPPAGPAAGGTPPTPSAPGAAAPERSSDAPAGEAAVPAPPVPAPTGGGRQETSPTVPTPSRDGGAPAGSQSVPPPPVPRPSRAVQPGSGWVVDPYPSDTSPGNGERD